MKAERQEVNQIFEALEKKSRVKNIGLVHQAALEATELTNSAQWNIYLQQLQALLNKSTEAYDNLLHRADDPYFVDPNELRRNSNAILQHIERINTLKEVMNLPKTIIERGEQASELL